MKKILMLLALAGMSSVVMAQQRPAVTEQIDAVRAQNKFRVVTNPFWSNWFFSIGGGAEVTFGDNDTDGSFGRRISPTLNVALGKWFTPGLGLRLQYSGLEFRGYTYDVGGDYVRGTQIEGGYYKQRFDYMNLHGDVMFNLNALFGGYNQRRVYEIIPYVGAGFTHSYTKPRREALSINGGIINRFRISNAVDINLELNAMGVEDKFDGEVAGKHGHDLVLGATAGLTFRFPTRGFKHPKSQLISQAELAIMQEKLAQLVADNQQLQSDLLVARNKPVEEVVEPVAPVPDLNIAPRTVFFNIGSADVSPREAMNLSYLAERMKLFPDATYTVMGYADAGTGTPEFNKQLGLKRAQAVVDVLVKQYGISADRLKIDSGGGVDTFGQAILNRVVLVKSAGF